MASVEMKYEKNEPQVESSSAFSSGV